MRHVEPSIAKRLLDLRRKGSVLDITDATKDLIGSAHEVGVRWLRERKILTARHNLDVVDQIVAELRPWSITAPIPSGAKRLLRHHLEVCRSFQVLFTKLDTLTAASSAWSAPTDELLLRILAFVERAAKTHIEAIENFNAEVARVGTTDAALEGHMALTRSHRDICDAGVLLLRQSAKRGGGFNHGAADDVAVGDLFELAQQYDSLRAAFDAYSYYGWQILLRGNAIRLIPTMSDFDRARHWAGLRTHSNDAIDRMVGPGDIAKVIDRASEQTLDQRETLLSFALERSGVFGQIVSQVGEIAQRVSTLRKDSLGLFFDLDRPLAGVTKDLTLRDFLGIWETLVLLTLVDRIRSRIAERAQRAWAPPVFEEWSDLVAAIATLRGVGATEAESLLQLVTARPEPSHDYDPFFRPIVKLESGRCALAESYAESSRLDRNVAAMAGRAGARELAVRGYKPLHSLADSLRSSGFACVLNVPVVQDGRVLTDIDVAFAREDHLFLAQAKMMIEPDSTHEVWSSGEKLKAAAGQLARTLAHEGSVRTALAHAGLTTANTATTIVAFILTNIFEFTGTTLEGFSIADVSYLQMLLGGGRISVHTPEGSIECRLISGTTPTPAELGALIGKPIHREMFDRRRLETHVIDLAGASLIVPARIISASG